MDLGMVYVGAKIPKTSKSWLHGPLEMINQHGQAKG